MCNSYVAQVKGKTFSCISSYCKQVKIILLKERIKCRHHSSLKCTLCVFMRLCLDSFWMVRWKSGKPVPFIPFNLKTACDNERHSKTLNYHFIHSKIQLVVKSIKWKTYISLSTNTTIEMDLSASFLQHLILLNSG